MRTVIVDDILSRIDGRRSTGDELRQREERRRDIARLVSDISTLQPRDPRRGEARERRIG